MRALKFIFSRLFICIAIIAALIAAIIFLCVYIHSLLPAAVALGIYCAVTVCTDVLLLCGDCPAEFACGWLIVIAALPLAGAVLYLTSSFCRGQRRCPCPALAPTGYDSYEYFADGGVLLKRLEECICHAKKNVYLEFYIIARGEVWNGICSALGDALARGVEVKIICDGLGSALRAPKKDFKRLERAGACIKIYNRVIPLPSSQINFRDHRKIAAIDGRLLLLGGVNLADEYAHITSPHGLWKDGGALLYGQAAQVFEGLFMTAFGKEYVPPKRSDGEYCLPIADSPDCTGGVCEDWLARRIYTAKRTIYIFTPYLCMGAKLEDALADAAQRGVDVKIIIPGVPDKKFTYRITLTYAKRLAARGAKVFAYTPGFMHFKGVLCDGEAMIGSYNFDFRSMRLNNECGVIVRGGLADELARDFESTLALCRPLENVRRALPLGIARVIAPLV